MKWCKSNEDIGHMVVSMSILLTWRTCCWRRVSRCLRRGRILVQDAIVLALKSFRRRFTQFFHSIYVPRLKPSKVFKGIIARNAVNRSSFVVPQWLLHIMFFKNWNLQCIFFQRSISNPIIYVHSFLLLEHVDGLQNFLVRLHQVCCGDRGPNYALSDFIESAVNRSVSCPEAMLDYSLEVSQHHYSGAMFNFGCVGLGNNLLLLNWSE